MDAIIILAQATTITIIITIITLITETAHITHTSSARETAFIGTADAVSNRIYIILALGDRPVNIASALLIYSQLRFPLQLP